MSDIPSIDMSPLRPYLLRALVDWITDNGLTPHLQVDAQQPGVVVPTSAVRDGMVVLNIAPRAVSQFSMDLEEVRFLARFGGVSQSIRIPVVAIQAVFVRENGRGMVFPDEAQPTAAGGPVPRDPADLGGNELPDGHPAEAADPPKVKGAPRLRVIK